MGDELKQAARDPPTRLALKEQCDRLDHAYPHLHDIENELNAAGLVAATNSKPVPGVSETFRGTVQRYREEIRHGDAHRRVEQEMLGSIRPKRTTRLSSPALVENIIPRLRAKSIPCRHCSAVASFEIYINENVEHLHGIRCGKCGREHPINPRDYTAVGMKGQWLKSWRNEDGSQA
jgi:hypothetical protein